MASATGDASALGADRGGQASVGDVDAAVPDGVRTRWFATSRGQDRRCGAEHRGVGLPVNDDWTAWDAEEVRAAINYLDQMRAR